MQDYKKDIIIEGTKTLENFLLLLKEDYLLHKNLKERRILDTEKFEKLISNAEEISNEEALEISELSMAPDDFFEYRTVIDKQAKASRSQNLASNSYFIYLFALFDQFILRIASISIKNEPEIKINYKKYCTQFYERNQIKELLNILSFEDELIDYLPKLSKLSSPIKTISKIFGINFEHQLYREHFFNFVEMKERRNLLVHRSGIADELYLKTISSYLSKFPQKERNDFLKKLEKNKNKELKIDPFYFRRTIKTLYFIVSVIVSHSFSKVGDSNDKLILFTNPFNELLIFSLKNKYIKSLLKIPLELYSLYLSVYLENDIKKMSDVDKVNWILCIYANKEMTKDLLKNISKNDSNNLRLKKLEDNQALTSKVADKEIMKVLNSIEDELIKEIVNAFLIKNYPKYIDSVFLYSKKENYPLRHIESNWYMQKKLSENEEFMKEYSSYKNKNFQPDDVRIKLPKNIITKIKKRKN